MRKRQYLDLVYPDQNYLDFLNHMHG